MARLRVEVRPPGVAALRVLRGLHGLRGDRVRAGVFDYYFLATGVFLLLVDFTYGRPPLWSVGWIVATRYGLMAMVASGPTLLTAVAFLAAAIGPIAVGLSTISHARPPLPARPAATSRSHLNWA